MEQTVSLARELSMGKRTYRTHTGNSADLAALRRLVAAPHPDLDTFRAVIGRIPAGEPCGWRPALMLDAIRGELEHDVNRNDAVILKSSDQQPRPSTATSSPSSSSSSPSPTPVTSDSAAWDGSIHLGRGRWRATIAVDG